MYSFFVLVGTGVYLTLFFVDSTAPTHYHGPYQALDGTEMTRAYRSVLDLSFSVKAGLLMRQTHHWAANVFIAAIVLHLLRIFFTGAFRKPRELTYYVGVTMLLLAAGRGLPRLLARRRPALRHGPRDRVLGGAVAPVRRASFAALVWGGQFPGGAAFWSRMYIAHVLVLPVLIGGLLAGPPRPRRGAAPHAVPRVTPAHRKAGCRNADVPGLRASLSRPRVCGRGRALPTRRARPDQPGLALGPVPRRHLDERRATRLVSRLADRGASARAGLRRRGRQLHRCAERLLGWRALPARRLRRALPLAAAREGDERRPPLPQPARAAARQPVANRARVGVRDVGRPRLPRRAPPIASRSTSASPTSARSGSTACSSGSARRSPSSSPSASARSSSPASGSRSSARPPRTGWPPPAAGDMSRGQSPGHVSASHGYAAAAARSRRRSRSSSSSASPPSRAAPSPDRGRRAARQRASGRSARRRRSGPSASRTGPSSPPSDSVLQ